MPLVNPNWLVWLTQSYDIASLHPPTLQPFSSKNTSCAGTLCCPALIAGPQLEANTSGAKNILGGAELSIPLSCIIVTKFL